MTEPRPNSCNQHIDCDAADARQLERFKAWEVEESQKAGCARDGAAGSTGRGEAQVNTGPFLSDDDITELRDEAKERRERATAGIEGRYYVRRMFDDKGKHDDCWYWVLDIRHDPIARETLRLYAEKAREAGYTQLWRELMERLAQEGEK